MKGKQVYKKLVVYDTGFGLSVCPDFGDIACTIDVVVNRLFKVDPPNPWSDEAWERLKDNLSRIVDAYNEKYSKGEIK